MHASKGNATDFAGYFECILVHCKKYNSSLSFYHDLIFHFCWNLCLGWGYHFDFKDLFTYGAVTGAAASWDFISCWATCFVFA